MWSKLVEQMENAHADLSSLRSIRFGGAPIAAHRFTGGRSNGGGRYFVRAGDSGKRLSSALSLAQSQIGEAVKRKNLGRLASAGLPMLFCKVSVADDQGNLLPVGETGEVVRFRRPSNDRISRSAKETLIYASGIGSAPETWGTSIRKGFSI
jgi:hypothetical protein